MGEVDIALGEAPVSEGRLAPALNHTYVISGHNRRLTD